MIYCYNPIIVTVQYQVYRIQETKTVTQYWHDFVAVADQVNVSLVPRHMQATNNRGNHYKLNN